MRRSALLGIACAWLVGGVALGQAGGALPKGNSKSLDAKMKAAEPEKAAKKKSCFVDLAVPHGGNGVFSADGGTLWILINRGAEAKAKANGKDKEKAPKKLTLYKVDLAERKAEPVLAVDYRPSATIITHGDPVEAVSAIVFTGEDAHCYQGQATVVSVAFEKATEKAVQTSGHFELVASPRDWLLFDQKKSQILETDLASGQRKLARKVPAKERPLFYDASAERLVVWHDDGKQRGLVRYDGDGAKPKRLAFKAGDRVLQSGGRFAALRAAAEGNRLEITELADWGGDVKKPGKYAVALPPAHPVDAVAVDVNLEERRLLVTGATFFEKQQWQRVFVYDYTKPDPVVVVQAPKREFPHFAALAPSGAYAVVEMRDKRSRHTTSLKVYDFAKKSTADVELPAPK